MRECLGWTIVDRRGGTGFEANNVTASLASLRENAVCVTRKSNEQIISSLWQLRYVAVQGRTRRSDHTGRLRATGWLPTPGCAHHGAYPLRTRNAAEAYFIPCRAKSAAGGRSESDATANPNWELSRRAVQ
jgi:hypothetical protein